ncbi:hypothetical protein D9613_008910 [Agrocybe pediades]|uniref:DUF6533 domain-containing protein n=1 Tax=Agrocybe pediades TaxID=84607 RepID=A0A8H4QV15_9AGAR|nr:hypothetical protein D9613_008910 [Agrocybe pediades]
MDDIYKSAEHIAFLKSLVFRERLAFAWLIIVVCEYLATLREEFTYIWRKPFNSVRFAYVFSRYFGLAVQSTNLYLVLGPLSRIGLRKHTCQQWFAFQLSAVLLLFASLDFILMLRIYALYRKDHAIGAILCICFVAHVGVVSVYGRNSIYDVPYDAVCNAMSSAPGLLYFG